LSPAVAAGRHFRLMGIINVTPDSFSDGGEFLDPRTAIAHGLQLAAQGAQILDVGGESTRPGAAPVSAREELERVIPVIEELARRSPDTQISIDTSKAAVASAALQAGASLINDVTALRGDREMASTVADSDADCCLMHMQGEPRTMQENPSYADVVDDVKAFLEERLAFAVAAGICEQRILLDPGIGFGKTDAQNLQLLARLDELTSLGAPILIGTSRKGFIGRILTGARGEQAPVGVQERLAGGLATCVMAYERGASVFRVHDVTATADALALAAATLSA
jgi:dihydropteroate synthase